MSLISHSLGEVDQQMRLAGTASPVQYLMLGAAKGGQQWVYRYERSLQDRRILSFCASLRHHKKAIQRLLRGHRHCKASNPRPYLHATDVYARMVRGCP